MKISLIVGNKTLMDLFALELQSSVAGRSQLKLS